MSQEPTISIFTAQTGHTSIAESINHTLKNYFTTYVNDVTDKAFNLYYPFYIYFPQLFKIPYKISEMRQAMEVIKKISEKSFNPKIIDLLKQQQPDFVVSTWYIPNPVLVEQQKHHHYHFLNIITDPRTFHGLVPSKKAFNFVFDQTATKRCIKLGIDDFRVVESGWFVRPHYQPPKSKFHVRKQLSLDPETLTILVTAGSAGTNLVLKILPAFINYDQPVNVLFACGNNKNLFNTIQNINKLNKRLKRHSPAKLIPLKFTHKLHLYMQASDLVVGKAGPNLIFESVATQTPFFAITHISGHEDGNLDIIKDYQIGYVEENLVKANQLLIHIINNPKELEKFQSHLKKLALHNQKAGPILLKTIASLTPKPRR